MTLTLRSRVEPQDDEWEITQSAYRGEKAVTYETSYLPFLFPSFHDTPAADGPSSLSPSNALRPRGRRVFNKRGEEITQQASSPTTDPAPPVDIDRQATEQTKMARPHSISSTKKANRDPSKDAKNVIFHMNGVGTDLRQSSAAQRTAFLRPSGVDPPPDPAKTSSPPLRPKPKRSRSSAPPDKPNKKTKLARIE